ncbi:HD domain-containing protein [Gordonia sp. CPCC 205333]|uniref:HD domain-containing protein n=1 Tax=Gordonia sp. CPCC 205333 TaxID=3140790 RepID=UPI003AF3EEAF
MSVELIERARSIAEERLSGQSRRWAHVQGVAATMEQLAQSYPVTVREVLLAAAWLHDVGYSESVRDCGFHPVDGARFVLSQGFPELVASLIAYHTGATVEAEERGLTSELAPFTHPPTELLDALTSADMMTGPDGVAVSPAARVEEILTRYPAEDPVHRAVSRSAPELLAAVARVKGRD